MATATVTNVSLSGWDRSSFGHVDRSLALVIAWTAEEPGRVGEVALIGARPAVLGRGAPECEAGEAPLHFVRQRPDGQPTQPGLRGRGISRRQLVIERDGDRLRIRRVGRCELSISGQVCDLGEVGRGDTVLLKNQLLLVCVERPERAAPLRHAGASVCPEFGAADRHGMVGESEVAWQWRDSVAFFARANQHVLVMGESGTGKELTARAIHAESGSQRELVARNAATLPQGLIDAELFGNARSYPNPGTPEREGLVGAANGSTLFLDEIGELDEAMQAHLLRVLDQGEYQRLGEAAVRSSRFRFIGATNRDPEALKHDFLARLTLRLTVPGLDERPDDIGLLIAHLASLAARSSESVGQRFFADGVARISPRLVDALVRHRYQHHVRELSNLLWTAIGSSDGNFVALTGDVEAKLETTAATSPRELDAEALTAALEAAQGNRAKAAASLGISRFALYRLLKKHGL